jgi:hypothetical protein
MSVLQYLNFIVTWKMEKHNIAAHVLFPESSQSNITTLRLYVLTVNIYVMIYVLTVNICVMILSLVSSI